MSSRKEFAKRLLAEMVKREMSQADLARAAGMSRDAISRYVRQVSIPDLSSIEKLAKALDTTSAELYPNYDAMAIDTDKSPPTYSLRAAEDDPRRSHLEVNHVVPTSLGTKILSLLAENDEHEADLTRSNVAGRKR